ncbi:MAG: HAMP domain-containing histidine kinase [bacterium]|nr:HAMP domain-containing histidine kinase [bacterium]
MSDPQSKAAFLRKMAHEMRTPLASMLMLAELLADNPSGTMSARELGYAGKIQTAGTEIRDLLQAVLDLSRIETDAIEATVRDVPVAELITEIEKDFAQLGRLAGGKPPELEISIDDALPTTIRTDPAQLRRLVGHLLAHAAATGGGPIDLTGAPAGDSEGGIVVTVGGGLRIPADQRPTIFEPFRPGSGRGKRALDLAIANALAGLLGGSLTPSPGDGEIEAFVLYLSAT